MNLCGRKDTVPLDKRHTKTFVGILLCGFMCKYYDDVSTHF